MVVTESEDGRKKYDKKLHNVLQLIDQLEKRKATIIKEIRNSVSTKQTN
jgi:DNA-directed RNA polymerase specialized sigma54-like protein